MQPFRLGRVDLEAARSSMVGAAVTYPTSLVGATLGTGAWPSGYGHDRRVRAVGRGAGDFVRARDAMRSWRSHAGAGFEVHPASPPALDGILVQRLGLGPLSILACLRVVAVVEEERRLAVAMGTLPLHVEEGEEAFVLTLDEDDVVRFRVLAFSRPTHPLVRLGAPVARVLQQRAHAGYCTGIERAVEEAR